MRRKPVDIGNTVRRNLMLFRQTGVPVAPSSEHDAGNGAAMRVLPVALATLGQSADGRARSRAGAGARHAQQPVSDAVCEFLDAGGAGLSARI
jgi:ADP-ribosyl-[dinitrogen reductase] hydrolase